MTSNNKQILLRTAAIQIVSVVAWLWVIPIIDSLNSYTYGTATNWLIISFILFVMGVIAAVNFPNFTTNRISKSVLITGSVLLAITLVFYHILNREVYIGWRLSGFIPFLRMLGFAMLGYGLQGTSDGKKLSFKVGLSVVVVLYIIYNLLQWGLNNQQSYHIFLSDLVDILYALLRVMIVVVLWKTLSADSVTCFLSRVPKCSLLVAGLFWGMFFVIPANKYLQRWLAILMLILAPVFAYICSVVVRFAIKLIAYLIRGLISEKFWWKEVCCWWKKGTLNFLLIITIGLLSLSCNRKENKDALESQVKPEVSERGVYHWKTTFDLAPEDSAFIKEHKITRLYVRMFDVGMERNESNDSLEVVPLGTTRFKSRIPEGCTLIPTVFITQEALRAYCYGEWKLAELIVERVKAMCSWNDLGAYDEIQYDCDWTESSRKSFERLCQATEKILKNDGISLSGTIRLHQLGEATYPFARGVLMIYNTGSFVNFDTKNSILDYDDVSKYLSSKERIRKFLKARQTNCRKIDIAYPAFNWGVLFDKNGQFKRLVKDIDGFTPENGDCLRVEKSDYKEIEKVKHLIDSLLSPAINSNIIYHLDSNNLKNYSSEELEEIYN